MKKYLLPNNGNFYKANMHVHTNVSDGRSTPEEVKAYYQNLGYSVVAFTDHEVFIPHNDLTDNDFVAINSVEVAVNDNWPLPFIHNKSYHINFYAKNDKITECFACTGYSVWLENSKRYISDYAKNNNFGKFHSVNAINTFVKKCNENGFLACYNHPVWSLHNYADYSGLKGLWAVEVYNTGSALAGYEDTAQPFEDLLRENEPVLPICADDLHSLVSSAVGGWTMIKAENLTYDSIMVALEKGDIYSSNGPSINELYIENGIVNISTSNAVFIKLVTDIRYTKYKRAKRGEFLTGASFDINDFIKGANDENNCRRSLPWFRLEVVDERGYRAYTKAYFIKDL